MTKKFKIAIAGFQHESNSFSPEATTYEDYLRNDGWPGLAVGDEIFSIFKDLNIPLSGFMAAASSTCEVVPLCWGSAEPYGPVSKDAFDRIIKIIVDGIRDAGEIDGVFLDLHGAMVCEHHEDGEGATLQAVRDLVGLDLPIVISLDYHANITPESVELCDAICIYRTYPHLDMTKTGERSYDMLMDILTTGKKPFKAWRQLPFLIPLSAQHTGSEPSKTLYDALPGMVVGDVTNADIASGFPPADIWHSGPSVVAYGTTQEAASKAADDLYDMVLAAEADLIKPLFSAEEAVERAMAAGRPGTPAIIADVQDNAGAGGSSDTTGLLRSLVASGAKGAVMSCLWDADSAAIAHAAGEGETVTIGLGGKSGPDGVEPFQSRFIVEKLSDGVEMCHGEMMGGFEINLGPTALLRVDDPNCDVSIVVSTDRAQCLDQAFFRVAGVEPSEQTILILKSTVHYRADFEAMASEIIMCACPGVSYCELAGLPYKNLRKGVRVGPMGKPFMGA